MAVNYFDLSRQNEPIQEELLEAAKDIIHHNNFIKGAALTTFEANFAKRMGVRHAVGVNSATDAAMMTLHALGVLEPGVEIICPAFGFIQSASVIPRLGANITFVDVNQDYLIDIDQLRASITENTRVILVPHLFGRMANMAALTEIASTYGIHLVEDCTHAIGAEYQGKPAGSLGIAGIFSFYPTRNLGALGDGGMVITDNDELATRLRLYRDLGQNESGTFVELGYNSRLDAMQASFLDLKLQSLDEDNEDRVANAQYYNEALANSAYTLPGTPPEGGHVYSHYTLRHVSRDQVRNFLRERQIETRVYYETPLHLAPCFAYLGYQKGHFPVAEQMCNEVFQLPISPGLSRRDLKEVAHALDLYAQTYSAPLPS